MLKCCSSALFSSSKNVLKVLKLPPRFASSTVFALSSGHGKCGVAIIRITGDKSTDVLRNMTRLKDPKPRVAHLSLIYHPLSGEALDKGLVLWFPHPHSFTGEDLIELQVHGGSAVVSAILSSLGTIPNFFPAMPGDFTKRAFYNGKLDLTEVEGLGDLIHAETEAQRRQALRQMEGSLSQIYTRWRNLLLKSRAYLEAYIDFSEEENIENTVVEEVKINILTLCKEISEHLNDDRRGEMLKSGLHLVILGEPNVGKSSFLNEILQKPKAIVSPIAGTTRDVIETTIDLGGYPVILSDTAGLRTTIDPLEKEGVKRALAKVKEADLAIIMIEARDVYPYIENGIINIHKFLKEYMYKVGVFGADQSIDNHDCRWINGNNYIILVNKIDLLSKADKDSLNLCIKDGCYAISVLTQEGIKEIIIKMKELCSMLCSSGSASESPFLTSVRHRIHLECCFNHLKSVINPSSLYNVGDTKVGSFEYDVDSGLLKEETIVLAAQELILAGNQLGYITGHITTEDVLDHIFSSFCIGK